VNDAGVEGVAVGSRAEVVEEDEELSGVQGE